LSATLVLLWSWTSGADRELRRGGLITIYNFKGGAGKTSCAMNIALTMDYGVVTNDIYSPIEEVFDNVLKVSPSEEFPDFPTDAEVIFDLGGYIEARSITVLRNSKVVLVPTINEYSILQTTINSVAEIEEYNTNICLIANRTKRGDYGEIRQILSRFYKYPIFEVKESQSIPAIFKKKKSIKAMVEEGGLQKYHFQYLDRQFDKIIEFIRRHYE
jgi:cellulose biosynthesis protein BcsQ